MESYQADPTRVNHQTVKPKKFYVVWKGRSPGIYESWDLCREQVFGFPQPIFKSFKSLALAQEAFNGFNRNYAHTSKLAGKSPQTTFHTFPIRESISVDAGGNNLTGRVEYRCVHTSTGEIIYESDAFFDGTINIAEFIAIVQALCYCKENDLNLPIYSDSATAICWVKNKRPNTTQRKTKYNVKLFELLDWSINWLKENDFSNQILKWETKAWGEIPADYDRK